MKILSAAAVLVLLLTTSTQAAITSTPPITGTAGVAYSYQVNATGNGLTYALTSAPAGMTVNAAGLVTWTPPAPGKYTMTVRVIDPTLPPIIINILGMSFKIPAASSQSWIITVK